MVNPVLVALDFPSWDEASEIAQLVARHVGGFKVGLELIMGEGPDVINRSVEMGVPVFVDAKLHDIPNTVGGAARRLGERGARWVTVHASGGSEMMEAAVAGLRRGSDGRAGILAVTVLTSLDESALGSIGVGRSMADQVGALASQASDAGAEGVICSAHEIADVKRAAPRLLAVTPGIRPRGAATQDQKRVATPETAIASGADYIVVGRAITGAEDVVAAAKMIAISAGFNA